MEIPSSAASFFKVPAAESLFGSTSADAIIAAGVSSNAGSNEQIALATTIAAKREINRIRGYKIELSPAEKQRLLNIRTDIEKIEAKVGDGTVREDELVDRAELLEEADRIIGKPIIDVEADAKLAEYNALKVAILEPRLDNATRDRVEFLERFKSNVEKQILESPDRLSLQRKLTSVSVILNQLNPLRSASQLSAREAKTYDDVVELINDHAGVKVELTAAETRRVEALERAITDLQGSLPNVSQPSSQQAARAYVALTR